MNPESMVETPLISPQIATLIPYRLARRLCVVAVGATPREITVLVPSDGDASVLAEIQAVTGRTVSPIETPREEIASLLDHLSGTLNTDDLWLQQRHVDALGRLVDHSVNVGRVELVRSLVDRALEFAPYSADVWLMKARVTAQRKDLIDALTIASQIAPNDRRILRWVHSMQDLDDEPAARVHAPVPQQAVSGVRSAPDMTVTAALESAPISAGSQPISRAVAPVQTPRSALQPGPAPVKPAESRPPQPVQEPSSASEVERVHLVPNTPEPARDAPRTTVSTADFSFQAARTLSAVQDLDEILRLTAESLQTITEADSVSVYFREDRGWSGYSTSAALRVRMDEALPKRSRLAAQAVRQGLPIVITETGTRLDDVGELIYQTGIRSFALLPVRTDDTVGGLAYLNFNVPERANDIFDSELGRGIELILNCAGNVAAGAVRRARPPKEHAAIDALTDAYSLEQFERLLAAEIERARRYRFSISLVSLDVDDFSAVIDRYGQDFGDEMLRQIAATLRAMARASDLLCRSGADEFLVMLPQTTAKGAEVVTRRLHRTLSEGFVIQHARVRASVSTGIAAFPEQAQDAASLLKAAETALHRAKAEGKNRPNLAETCSLTG